MSLGRVILSETVAFRDTEMKGSKSASLEPEEQVRILEENFEAVEEENRLRRLREEAEQGHDATYLPSSDLRPF